MKRRVWFGNFIGRTAPFMALRAAFIGRCWIETEHGPVCPHRGAPLGSVKPDDRGHVYCPLHGLVFDAATGQTVHDLDIAPKFPVEEQLGPPGYPWKWRRNG